jgi:hypothetical protein
VLLHRRRDLGGVKEGREEGEEGEEKKERRKKKIKIEEESILCHMRLAWGSWNLSSLGAVSTMSMRNSRPVRARASSA